MKEMSALKNIVVIGGSGNVGREILGALIERKDEFGTISALKREGVETSDILKRLESKGVRILEANFKNKESLVTALKGIRIYPRYKGLNLGADAVISTVNVPAFEDQYLFVDAAIEAKYARLSLDYTDNRVKRFFPSEFGSNTNLPDIASIPYLQPKIKFAHYVEEKAKQGLIEYTLVNTGRPIHEDTNDI